MLIDGLEVRGRIGCSPEERAYPQRMVISLEMEFQPGVGAYSGDLNETICWYALQSLITGIVTGREWVLVEELSKQIVDEVFEKFPRSQELKLSIRKFPFEHIKSVGIETKAKRSE